MFPFTHECAIMHTQVPVSARKVVCSLTTILLPVPGCQLDYTSEKFVKPFEVGRPTFKLALLRYEDLPLIWAIPSGGRLYKGHGRRKEAPYLLSLFYQVHPFTDITAYFFRIPAHTEGQMRYPALWVEQLLDYWTFHW